MDRDDITSSPGRASGEDVGGLELATTGTEYDTSTSMAAVSASVVNTELSGMTIVPFDKLV